MSKLPQLASWLLFAEEGAKDQPTSSLLSELPRLLPFVAIFVLFYFMLLRPERRKRADLAKRLENLDKNDRILTMGGIYATVVNAPKGSPVITVRFDETSNQRVRISRSAISRLVTDEETGEAKADV